jgi:hypothetical protein
LDAPSPVAPAQTFVSANYAAVQAPAVCTPGTAAVEHPALDVLTYAAGSTEARAQREAFVAEANAIDTGGTPDERLHGGSVPVVAGGQAVVAYLVPQDDGRVSALFDLAGSTVVVSAAFDRTTLQPFLTMLNPR